MKNRLILYMVLILSFCLLMSCGCSQAKIRIESEIPPKTELHFLMKIDKDDLNEYNGARNTELLRYYEDGYACADIYLKDYDITISTQLPANHNITFLRDGKYCVSTKGGIKLVLTDQTGKILKISEMIAIYDEENKSYIKDIEWDHEKNTVSLGESSSLYRENDLKTFLLCVIKQEEVWLAVFILVATGYCIKKKTAEKRH